MVNPGTNPVNSYNVDNGAIQPIQITCEINMQSGTAMMNESCTDQSVPVGKRLVIEHITAQARFNNKSNFPNESIGLVSFDMSGDLKWVFHYITFEQQILTKYSNIFYAAQNVRLYAFSRVSISVSAGTLLTAHIQETGY